MLVHQKKNKCYCANVCHSNTAMWKHAELNDFADMQTEWFCIMHKEQSNCKEKQHMVCIAPSYIRHYIFVNARAD